MTECIHKCFQLISNGNALSALSAKSEQLRRDFAEQLRATNIKKEYLRNRYSKLSQAKQLSEVKFEIVEEQLKLLYDSMQNLFQSKNKKDEVQTEILFVKKQCQDLKFERDKFQ